MNIKEIRELTGLSQKGFSEKYGIPCRSIENWESGQRQCPDYVLRLLEYKVKTEITMKTLSDAMKIQLQTYTNDYQTAALYFLDGRYELQVASLANCQVTLKKVDSLENITEYLASNNFKEMF